MKTYRWNGREYEFDDERKVVFPQEGGQWKAYWTRIFEVLGGGSAGGGKSWYLVLDALGLQYVQWGLGKPAYMHDGYRGVLFRRESTQLDRLISEAKNLYPGCGGEYVGGRQGEPGPSFEFPEFGSKIFFCHLQHEDDKENHQGQEYQYIGFDELTHFTITQYLYLFSRARSTIAGLFPRIRGTTNPTGEGLWWVRKRFIDGLIPEEVRYFLPPDDPENDPRGMIVKPGTEFALPRVFIPFWLSENKALVDNDPAYAIRMKAMGKQMERALLGGDWYAFGGDFWPDFDRHKELIDPFRIPKEWRLYGSIDPGFSAPCSFGLTAADMKGNYYRVATYYVDKTDPEKHAEAIKRFIQNCPWTDGRWPDVIVAPQDAWAKYDKYSVIVSNKSFADIFKEHGINLEVAVSDRVQGWWNWKRLMPEHWFVFKGTNDALVDEMSAATSDDKHLEDIKGCGNDPQVRDHALDECRYGLMRAAPSPPEKPPGHTWEDEFFGRVQTSANPKLWKPGVG